MRRYLFIVLAVAMLLIVTGCGGDDTADRIIGKWSGVIEGEDGDFPSEWEFTEDGKLVVIILPGTLNVVQTADYYFDDDGALRVDDGEGTVGRRVVEFVTDDVMTLTAEVEGTVTTLTRVTEE